MMGFCDFNPVSGLQSVGRRRVCWPTRAGSEANLAFLSKSPNFGNGIQKNCLPRNLQAAGI